METTFRDEEHAKLDAILAKYAPEKEAEIADELETMQDKVERLDGYLAVYAPEPLDARLDEVSFSRLDYDWSENDHPRNPDGTFAGGSMGHGIMSYKKTLKKGTKGTTTGLIQFMLKEGTYNQSDILAAANEAYPSTSAAKIMNWYKKQFGVTLPKTSGKPGGSSPTITAPVVPPAYSAPTGTPAPATTPPPSPAAPAPAASSPAPGPSTQGFNPDLAKTFVKNSAPPGMWSELEGVFTHFDKLTLETKPLVEAKLAEIQAAITSNMMNPSKMTAALSAITPITGSSGMSITAVNKALANVKSPGTPADTPKPSAPASAPKITTSPKRLAKAKALEAGAKQIGGANLTESKKVAPSLKDAFWDKVPAGQKSSVKHYTGGGSTSINSACREWSTAPSHLATQVNDIDELYDEPEAKLEHDVILKRGETVPAGMVDKWEAVLKSGVPLRYMKDGFISTSMNSHAAFGGNVIFEIVARKGTPALGVYTISSHKSEHEILLRHGQAFEIYEIERKGNQAFVRMVTA